MSEKNEEESEFVIKDKRSAYQSDDEIEEGDAEQEKDSAKQQKLEEQAAQQKEQEQEPSIDFATFVMSLASSAFYHLGDMPDPTTGRIEENLPAVKQTIDILMMLHSKTKNNLDQQEDKLLGQLIYELQMKFVAKNK